MSKEADNLQRWNASGGPRRWVEARQGRWDHHDWLALLADLRRSPFWPMHDADIGHALEQARADMGRVPEADPERPISLVGSAVMFLLAGGDTGVMQRIRRYVLDPDDAVADRWQFLRLAERDAWKAVELLLLGKGIQRRFREGELDAWAELTPFGADIRDAQESFYRSFGSLEFPAEPKGFTTCAFQEIRAARLAGELYAEPSNSAEGEDPGATMRRLAARLSERYPNFAQVVVHPDLNVPALVWFFFSFRLGTNEQMRTELSAALAGFKTPPSNWEWSNFATWLHNCPEIIEELIGDVYAQAQLSHRAKVTESRGSFWQQLASIKDEDSEGEAESWLERAVPILARTAAEAVAEAERLKESHDILVAQNSLWAWYSALPPRERQAIGEFQNKRDLWTARRRYRS